MSLPQTGFRALHNRLVEHARERVHNGELSERGLARLCRISQPHIHNVLKGERFLSNELADQMLERLHISLADLLRAGHAVSPETDPGEFRMVRLLDGKIGLQYPFPTVFGPASYPFPAADVDRLMSPAAAWLAADASRDPVAGGEGVVLLDCAEAVRLEPDETSYFALAVSGAGMIGLLRRGTPHGCLWSPQADGECATPLPGGNLLDLIRGRVAMIVRRL